jgi:hypothetical protein
VFATPPGSSRWSGAPSAAGGSGMSRTRSSSSATGAGSGTTWPVGSVSPGAIALRIRSSSGSRSSAAASLSICASCANATWTAPKPRIAPQGGLFVYATNDVMRAFGTAYGPAAKHAAFEHTAVELDAYAPPSSTIRART